MSTFHLEVLNSVVIFSLTFQCILIDSIAQSTEKVKHVLEGATIKDTKWDLNRSLRFAVFGFMDGTVGHGWFQWLDGVVRGSDNTAVVEKIILDTSIYTPIWCFWFVVAMSLLKGNWDVITTLKNEWKELAWLDLDFL